VKKHRLSTVIFCFLTRKLIIVIIYTKRLIYRGSLPSRARPLSGSFTRSRTSLKEEERGYYDSSHSRPTSQVLDVDLLERADSAFSRSSYSPSNLSVSSTSINERTLSPQDGAHFETLSCSKLLIQYCFHDFAATAKKYLVFLVIKNNRKKER